MELIKKKKGILFLFLGLLLLVGFVFYFFTLNGDGILRDGSESTSFIDSESNEYKTVSIGNQIWLAENLNDSLHSSGESWCYDEKDENCQLYGRLYDWEAAMVVCPEGWGLPSDEDWQELEKSIEGSDNVAEILKSKDLWSPRKDRDGKLEIEVGEFNGVDSVGFNGVPGGHYYEDYFYDLNSGGYWWSSTKTAEGVSLTRVLDYKSTEFQENLFDIDHGFSVRCIKK